jgi:hypothetical protein
MIRRREFIAGIASVDRKPGPLDYKPPDACPRNTAINFAAGTRYSVAAFVTAHAKKRHSQLFLGVRLPL